MKRINKKTVGIVILLTIMAALVVTASGVSLSSVTSHLQRNAVTPGRPTYDDLALTVQPTGPTDGSDASGGFAAATTEAKDKSVFNAMPTQESGDVSQEVVFNDSSSQSYSQNGAAGLPALDQRIVRSATLELELKKGQFDRSYGQVISLIETAGGYVSDAKSSATGGKVASGELTLRVPAAAFESTLNRLRKIGKIKSVDVSSQEVTEEYVDLEARLRNWKAQQVVMLDLMKRAKTISDSITVQNNLAQIQSEIERITGRIKYLDNKTAFTTIRLYLAEPNAVARPDTWGLSAAVKQALQASAQVIIALIVMAGYLIPLALILVFAYLIVKPVRRALSQG